MSEYTKKLAKDLSFVGCASRNLIDGPIDTKKAPAQQRVLDILSNEDGLTQGTLAEILDVRPSSLTEILKKLEYRNEIERVEDPLDKRIKTVHLTELGREKSRPHTLDRDDSEDFFLGISEEEQQQLELLLTKIIAGWQTDFGKLVDVPISPFESIKAFRTMHEQFTNQLEQLSPGERKQLKREMKEKLRHQFGRYRGFERPDGRNHHGRKNQCEEPQLDEREWDNW
ncbi:hypothetical protein IGI37_003468 [Enterococcus sp. AZ194]|uniref:MarR family winged helix-turn-helix transcriptional regulator n=1 Tax=Enterococcus sp. AZ194 TaxID=2774629 RepID=UPI003F284C09